MKDYIYKKLEKLNKQVSIVKILHYHKQWRAMTKERQMDYDNKFVLYLRKNKIFRDLLLLNSVFLSIQKHYSLLFPHYFCQESHEFITIMLIKLEETEFILDELKYGLTSIDEKRIDFTKRNVKKTKEMLLDFFQKEKNLFFLIFYQGSGCSLSHVDMIREIYEFVSV